MEQELTIEIVSQESPTAQEAEAAALKLIAGLFTERILQAARSELRITKKNEFINGENTTNYQPRQSDSPLFL